MRSFFRFFILFEPGLLEPFNFEKVEPCGARRRNFDAASCFSKLNCYKTNALARQEHGPLDIF